MILKASQRSGGRQLAAHLANIADNEHVMVQELRGFVATDLSGAFDEAHAISKGTKCRQFLFSLSLNPPKDQQVGIEAMLDAVNRAETALGLQGQPRAIVIHEKEGRRHMHAVWSRIDVSEMKAINMSHFKSKLCGLSKELYLENGWELPDGHRVNGWKNPLNFTLAEWQQAQRVGIDPREQKEIFRSAWARSDDRRSFANALEACGYYLARGDRRGFVAVDLHGEVYSISRMTGVKTGDVAARLGIPDGLPGVEQVKERLKGRIVEAARERLEELRRQRAEQLSPLLETRKRLVKLHRLERVAMERGQAKRQRRENLERSRRMRGGVRGLWDVLTGRAAILRRQNEREAFEGWRRDTAQREAMFLDQVTEKRAVQREIEEQRERHRREAREFVRRVAAYFRNNERSGKPRDRGPELSR